MPFVRVRLARIIVWASVLPALAAVFASPAGAVVVKLPDGHRVGVMVPPGHALPAGVVTQPVRQRAGVAPSAARSPGGPTAGELYNPSVGPVLRTADPYLVFWDPNGDIGPQSEHLIEQYLTDVSGAGTENTDVFGNLRQYYDSGGYAAQGLSFSTGSQTQIDTQPYPQVPATGCAVPTNYTACVTDAQVQSELTRLIAADGLPTGMGAGAPVYLVLLPQSVNECGPGTTGCVADGALCAYHGYVSGSSTLLYAVLPFAIFNASPKGCQDDGHSAYQSPNASSAQPLTGEPGDQIIDNLSHELSETITDPLLNAWISGSGWEVGDNCESTGALDLNPTSSGPTDPNAYLPTLGGSPLPAHGVTFGTLYDQLIGGHEYYTQTEWSNGALDCETQPAPSTLTPSISAPSFAEAGTSVSLDPTKSVASAGISSTTWDFGDGTSTFASGTPAATTHEYAKAGSYTVTLTLVDNDGNVANTTSQIQVVDPPVASFTAPTSVATGSQVTFDASASNDPNPGGSIATYDWSFGDGTKGTGEQPDHVYTSPGTYTVGLTVTDGYGIQSSQTTRRVTVLSTPTAVFSAASPIVVVDRAVTFDAAASTDPNPGGSLTSYAWTFGDGSSATGSDPQHAYAHAGTYEVTLTVTDSYGAVSSAMSQTVQVRDLPVAAFSASVSPAVGRAVSFDATGSRDPDGGSIAAYSWSFGDGSSGAGAQPQHVYTRPGTYAVTLTVTNGTGLVSPPSTNTIEVRALPTAALRLSARRVGTGQVLSFNARGSSDPNLGGWLQNVRWSFGDGATATGLRVRHAYARRGIYTVLLTVTDSYGVSSTRTETVVVVAAGRIVRTWAKMTRGVRWLLVSVSGPGRVTFAHHTRRLHRRGRARFQLHLSSAQLGRLEAGQRVRLKVTIVYAPRYGSVRRRTRWIILRP